MIVSAFAVGTTAAGCYAPGSPAPLPLEIGTRATAGFRPLADGDSLPVYLGSGGIRMSSLSLRGMGIDPRDPEAHVDVTVTGVPAARGDRRPSDLAGADGSRYVLWDLFVPFLVELCCLVSQEGVVTARVDDASGQHFERSIRVRFELGPPTDPAPCCMSASECPDPSLTRICP